MDKVDKQLKETDINVKGLIDWDNPDKVEQLSLYLRELQTDLEAKMTQSI